MSTLIDQIKQLERQSAALSPDQQERTALNEKVLEVANQFLEELPHSNVYNLDHAKDKRPEYTIGATSSLDELLQFLHDDVDVPGINAASGRHLGYVPGGGIYGASLGDYLAAVYNKFASVYFAGPGAVRMENELIIWMGELVGFDQGYAGNLASGGSMASLIAMVTARDAHQIKGADVAQAVIYTSEQVHHCLIKAIHVAGVSDCVIRHVELDDHHRINPTALKGLIEQDLQQGLKPWMIIGSAGTTDTGAIDPLPQLGDLAGRYDLWFHVDAAYGGFFLMCETIKDKLAGIEKAHSVVMDPHKGLFLPYGIGAVVVRDGSLLYRAHNHQANYMQDTFDANEEVSPADLSPELSRHFRGLRMWLPLKLYGLEPFKACLEEKICLARYFYETMQQREGFELGPFPDLTVSYFRYLPANTDANTFNQRLVKAIQQDGRVFLSSTMVDGKFVIRMAILAFRTHLREVNMALDIIDEKVDQLLAE